MDDLSYQVAVQIGTTPGVNLAGQITDDVYGVYALFTVYPIFGWDGGGSGGLWSGIQTAKEGVHQILSQKNDCSQWLNAAAADNLYPPGQTAQGVFDAVQIVPEVMDPSSWKGPTTQRLPRSDLDKLCGSRLSSRWRHSVSEPSIPSRVHPYGNGHLASRTRAQTRRYSGGRQRPCPVSG
jgi:hypothetical protein